MKTINESETKEPEVPKEILEEAEEVAKDWSGGWWNSRVIEKESRWKDKSGKEYFEKYFEIHEVYYNGEGEIIAWSQDPLGIYFENVKDVRPTIKQIKKAIKKPVLRLIKESEDQEELVPTMKTLKQYKKEDLSNFNLEDFWNESR